MVLDDDRILGVTGHLRRLTGLFRHDEKVGHVTANCEYYCAY